MNRARAKELLPIIKAFAEGEEIEFQIDPGFWRLAGDSLSFNSRLGKYRIKPKPREWEIHIGHAGNIIPDGSLHGVIKETIRVREVLDD